jgi:hypothetical protein
MSLPRKSSAPPSGHCALKAVSPAAASVGSAAATNDPELNKPLPAAAVAPGVTPVSALPGVPLPSPPASLEASNALTEAEGQRVPPSEWLPAAVEGWCLRFASQHADAPVHIAPFVAELRTRRANKRSTHPPLTGANFCALTLQALPAYGLQHISTALNLLTAITVLRDTDSLWRNDRSAALRREVDDLKAHIASLRIPAPAAIPSVPRPRTGSAGAAAAPAPARPAAAAPAIAKPTLPRFSLVSHTLCLASCN